MLAVLLKAAIFPLARKKVEYDMAMQSLQLNFEAILKQDAGDQDTIELETIPLYESSSIDPLLDRQELIMALVGCLLVLLKIPVWIGLYQAFSKMADG
ncbi:albino3-like protein chloroplastic-like, partial [Trifolium pratense]